MGRVRRKLEERERWVRNTEEEAGIKGVINVKVKGMKAGERKDRKA